MSKKKLYIYNTETDARSIVMTVHHLGGEANSVGSAVRMTAETYESLMEQTMAPPAAAKAIEERQ